MQTGISAKELLKKELEDLYNRLNRKTKEILRNNQYDLAKAYKIYDLSKLYIYYDLTIDRTDEELKYRLRKNPAEIEIMGVKVKAYTNYPGKLIIGMSINSKPKEYNINIDIMIDLARQMVESINIYKDEDGFAFGVTDAKPNFIYKDEDIEDHRDLVEHFIIIKERGTIEKIVEKILRAPVDIEGIGSYLEKKFLDKIRDWYEYEPIPGERMEILEEINRMLYSMSLLPDIKRT